MKSWSSRTATFVAAISVLAIAGPISQARATGTPILDPTYGTQGAVTITMPKQSSTSETADVIIDSNGNSFALVNINLWNGQQQFPVQSASVVKYTSSGQVDTTFANGVGHTAPVVLFRTSMALQADGKILLAGVDSTQPLGPVVVRRYLPTGALDTSFATRGIFSLTSLPGRSFMPTPVTLAVDNEVGRIIFGTNIDNGNGTNYNFYFVALTGTGAVESSWGNGGAREVIPRGGGVSAFSALTSMVIVSNGTGQAGSLLAVGSAYSNGKRQIVLVKLNYYGYLDTNFDGSSGGNGLVLTDFMDTSDAYMTAISLLPNGGIALAGFAGTYFTGPWFYAMAQFLADGTVDTTFAGGFVLTTIEATEQVPVTRLVKQNNKYYFPVKNGTQFTIARVSEDGATNSIVNYPHEGRALSIALHADQKIMVSGSSGTTSLNSALYQVSSSMVPDVAFGTDGFVQETFHEQELSMQVVKLIPQSNGSAIGIGSVRPVSLGFDASSQLVVFKLNSSGTVDDSFGENGFRIVQATNYENVEGINVAVQGDGKIVVVAVGSDPTTDVLLVRLSASGLLDSSFGNLGLVEYDSGESDSPVSILVDGDQQILVANNRDGVQYSAEVVRFSSQGTLDLSFDGTAALASIGASNEVNKMKFDASGKIVLTGGLSDRSRSLGFIARLLPNGQLDSTFSADGFTLVDLGDQEVVDSYSGLDDFVITNLGRITSLGYSNAPHNGEAIIFFDQFGQLDLSLGNSTGMTRFESRENVHNSWVNSIVDDGDGFLVVGGGMVDNNVPSTTFSSVMRFGSNGLFDTQFDGDGIYFPATPEASSLSHVARINSNQVLASGYSVVNETFQGLVMRIGVIPSVETTTPTTVSPSSTVVTQATVPKTSTTVPATVVTASSTTVPQVVTTVAPILSLKLVIAVSQANVLNSMKLTVPKGGVVVMSIAKSSAKVCKVAKKQVVGTASGTCRVTVTIKVKTKKNISKSTSFKVTA